MKNKKILTCILSLLLVICAILTSLGAMPTKQYTPSALALEAFRKGKDRMSAHYSARDASIFFIAHLYYSERDGSNLFRFKTQKIIFEQMHDLPAWMVIYKVWSMSDDEKDMYLLEAIDKQIEMCGFHQEDMPELLEMIRVGHIPREERCHPKMRRDGGME